jgi:hypothetical protein
MGRKPKNSKPLTEEEIEALKIQKAEYAKRYYKQNKERLLAQANKRYRERIVNPNKPVLKEDTIQRWNNELQDKLNTPIKPIVRLWILSQLNHNQQFINGKQKDMGKNQENWQ